MTLPVRSVLASVSAGGVLISPGSGLTIEQLESLKCVTDLVAPNLLHCAGIPNAGRVFPKARIWGPLNCISAKPNINWTHEISPKNWPFQNELSVLQIEGLPRTNECVFVHKKSKTLIVCDLCFNLTHPQGIGAWIILHLMGTYQKFAISKLVIKMIKDHVAFQKSIANIFSYDFENIVVSHGEIISGNGKEILRQAFLKHGIKV
jgi:hypothetical protein